MNCKSICSHNTAGGGNESPELHQMTSSSWHRPRYEPHVNLWQRSLANAGGEEAQLRWSGRESQTHGKFNRNQKAFFLPFFSLQICLNKQE